MPAAARHFGLTQAALVHAWVAEDARMMMKLRSSEEAVARVARCVVEYIIDWWPRFPACRELLESPHWDHYAWALTAPVVRQALGDAPAVDQETVAEHDFLDRVAAEALDNRGDPIMTLEEQQATHLRYRLGAGFVEVAHIMGLDDNAAQDLMHRARTKLDEAVVRWLEDNPDPDS